MNRKYIYQLYIILTILPTMNYTKNTISLNLNIVFIKAMPPYHVPLYIH